jgi:hypothetical protein
MIELCIDGDWCHILACMYVQHNMYVCIILQILHTYVHTVHTLVYTLTVITIYDTTSITKIIL